MYKNYITPRRGGGKPGRDNEGIQLFFLWEKVLKWRKMGDRVSDGPNCKIYVDYSF